MAVPDIRIRALRDLPPRPGADYVLYWMLAARRTSWNFALDRAVHWARDLKQPLLVLEALECDYPWASDRLHRFAIDGMRDNEAALARSDIGYYPYVEPAPGAGRGLLTALAASASVVVTDDAPVFFLPAVVAAAATRIDTRVEAVDGCGILPIHAASRGQVFPTAYAFRRFLQRELPAHVGAQPRSSLPRAGSLARFTGVAPEIDQRWPAADLSRIDLAVLPIDHTVAPAPMHGGSAAAGARLDDFVVHRLDRYGEGRNHPDDAVSSGLSPYLHFGHISSHEVMQRVLDRSEWTSASLSTDARGRREGWWNAPAPVESFLDELITWRELGYNMSARRPDVATFDALPSWAIVTLEKHARDPRAFLYSIDDLASAATHDEVWNAAQRQLVRDGRIHNYLRMLWGKKILEWTASPREALDVMVALNDRYAVDGRDPNSYSGITWVLGRYDRPWAPERPIYGTVRYMSSDNTVRKLRLKQYLRRYAENGVGSLFT